MFHATRVIIGTAVCAASLGGPSLQAAIPPYLYIESRAVDLGWLQTVNLGDRFQLRAADAFVQGSRARFDLTPYVGQTFGSVSFTVCLRSTPSGNPEEARSRTAALNNMPAQSAAWTEILGSAGSRSPAVLAGAWDCPVESGPVKCSPGFQGRCVAVSFPLKPFQPVTEFPASIIRLAQQGAPQPAAAPEPPTANAPVARGGISSNSPLHQAVRQRRLATVQSLLGSGMNPNVLDERGVTALHYAVSMRDAALVNALLGAGANPNIPGPLGRTPYDLALDTRSGEMIVPFVQRGADPNRAMMLARDMNDDYLMQAIAGGAAGAQNPRQWAGGAPPQGASTAADMAMFEELVRIRKYSAAEKMLSGIDPAEAMRLAFKYDARPMFPALVSGGASANEILKYAVSRSDSMLIRQSLTEFRADANFALDLAMSARDLQLARMALDLGAEPNRAMESAATQGAGPIVEELIRRNADPSIGLASAANAGQTAIVEYLLAKGANPAAAVPGAIRKGDVTLLGKLIRANADVRAPEFLSAVAGSRNSEMLRMLVAAGADPNAGTAGAVSANSVEDLRFLLDKGAAAGHPLLMEGAVRGGNPEMVGLLLERGADATPGLAAAVAAYNAPMVDRLLRFGAVPADPRLVETAAAKADSPVLPMLLLAGADPAPALWPAIKSGNGPMTAMLAGAGASARTPDYILFACGNGLTGPASALLSYGAPRDARDSRNRSLLHLAVEAWQPELVKALIQAGTDLNAKNNAGDTALHIVAQDESSRGYPKIRKGRNERLPILRALIEAGADIHALNGRGETALRVADGGDVKDALKRAGAIQK